MQCSFQTSAISSKIVKNVTLNGKDYEHEYTVQVVWCAGVGNTLGMGMYVLAGQITKTVTGPAIILSFTIAALATLLSGTAFADPCSSFPE